MDNFSKCPYVTAQKLLQGKWSILIMHHLDGETQRFNELQKKMPEMTHATLSSQLKLLEKEGLVERKVYAEVPPRVEYSLTEIGQEFGPVLDKIGDWGNLYISYRERQAQAQAR
ncbi:MAG: helix-turn-helix domain-containing protein [Eubacterium sp.]|nr:helix-turn-helix domain-containing protein [Eubacterium sp.]